MSSAVWSSLLVLLVAGPVFASTLTLGGGGISVSAPRSICATDESFEIKSILTGVTDTSVVVSVWPTNNTDIRVNYGTTDLMGTRTAGATATGGERHSVTLSSLTAATTYYYAVEAKATTEARWCVMSFSSFKTKPAATSTFRFGVGSDSHAAQIWVANNCGDTSAGWTAFQNNLVSAATSDLDLWFDLGDTPMTHEGANSECTAGSADEELGTGTIGTLEGAGTTAQRQAELRWQVVLQPEGEVSIGYRYLAASVPFFTLLGNHDGEFPIGDANGECNYYDGSNSVADTNASSQAARLAIFPNPNDTYGDDANGNYYDFTWGPVHFWLVDPYKFTTSKPAVPGDYTLGEAQLTWLENGLAASTSAWNIVLSHILVGGTTGVDCHAYGRGSIKATDDETTTGTFNGEEADIHGWMAAASGTGVRITAHDHIAASIEKPDAGVYYIVAGNVGGTEAIWKTNFIFEEIYDQNGTAEATEGPATIATDGTANTFTCTTCDFVASGFSADTGNLLDAANFAGSIDGTFRISSVTSTVITVTAGQGNEANLSTDDGDGDETLQMRMTDYREDPLVNGSLDLGWWRMTASPSRLLGEYIAADTGEIEYSYEITR